MKPILIYLISFAAGPAIFWVLIRQTVTRRYFTGLFLLSILLLAAAFLIPRLLSHLMQATIFPAVTTVFLLWLGWIVVVALCTLAIGERLTQPRARKWALALGAMATTLPWFGLYTAQIVAQ